MSLAFFLQFLSFLMSSLFIYWVKTGSLPASFFSFFSLSNAS